MEKKRDLKVENKDSFKRSDDGEEYLCNGDVTEAQNGEVGVNVVRNGQNMTKV